MLSSEEKNPLHARREGMSGKMDAIDARLLTI